MKIAISAALVLGVTQYAAAFPCTWNGGGSSYVYHNTEYSRGNAGNGCITSIDTRQAQTTCCRSVRAEDASMDWDNELMPRVLYH